MYRKCKERLISWAEREERGVMVLRGARQVGKTTLVHLLAKELDLTLIEVNMEETQSFTDMLQFKEKAKDILELIMLERGINLRPENVLFFFDEAQEVEGLYEYLRYFKEKAPEYRVIAAGSLFEFKSKKSEKPQGPTGRVEYSYLDPMSFEEYLLALNPVAYNKLIELPTLKPVPLALHNVFTKLFREYIVCGGMPAVVKAQVNGAGPLRLDEIKTDIVTGYLEDLPKYSELTSKTYKPELLDLLLRKILSSPSRGMKYSQLAPGYKANDVKAHLDVLVDARVIRRSLHTSQNKVPLLTGENPKDYKLFALDIGICYSFMQLHPATIYTSEDINDVVNGAIAEQYVAQTIASIPPFHRKLNLNHWERQKKGATSEVDFIIGIGGKVVPLECKAGNSNKLKSLKILLSEKEFPTSVRLYAGCGEFSRWDITMNNGNEYRANLYSIPHYLLERFCNLMSDQPAAISLVGGTSVSH
ncbi:ATP-binding protein [Thalassotalea sp. ND16A]|uniref:ATP-binding protein n=1 Tax=Thalassotalea sp. ND16A TaxID=1535422 RepID=UPI00051DFE5F|nr:AAA family ATPase [Thalassotalea sp. ND16A]KGJ94211.1 hypothetical protein ND16A_1417 [Thalassotalea sp. ND16A]